MLAWLMDSYQGVEKLRLGEVADPQPGPGQVLLRVMVAALNPADAFLAQALYPARPPLPHILGRDGVGDVLASGPGVEDARVGETVGILRCSAGVESGERSPRRWWSRPPVLPPCPRAGHWKRWLVLLWSSSPPGRP